MHSDAIVNALKRAGEEKVVGEFAHPGPSSKTVRIGEMKTTPPPSMDTNHKERVKPNRKQRRAYIAKQRSFMKKNRAAYKEVVDHLVSHGISKDAVVTGVS